MKYIKKFLCFAMCIFACFAFSACGKKGDNQQENSSPSCTELSLQKVLNETYKKLNAETNTKNDTRPSFSAKTESGEYTFKAYDDFVYEGIYLLKLLSETDKLQNNVWLYDDATKTSLLTGEANKLEMLYINRNKQDFVHKVEIYMLFSKIGFSFADFPKSYNMFCYEIEFNEKSEDLSVSFFLEKSNTSKNILDSYANYYTFSYKTDRLSVGANYLEAKSFLRLQQFDYENMMGLIPEYVNGYNFIGFLCQSNTAIIPDNLTTSKDEVKSDIRDTLKKFDAIGRKINDINATKKKATGLTDKFLKIANANKISDFII